MSVPEIFEDIGEAERPQKREVEEEEDLDLVTTLDIERKANKRRKEAKEIQKLQKAELSEQRSKWQSEKSDLIVYCKLLVSYFNFLNEDKAEEFDLAKIEEFCSANKL